MLLRYVLYERHSDAPVLAYELQRELPRGITPHVQSYRSVRRFFGEMFSVRRAFSSSDEKQT